MGNSLRKKREFLSVERQTEKLCIEAVKKNPCLLSRVKNQTERVCKDAIDKDFRSLVFVKNQTDSMCCYAIGRNVEALRFVNEQTELICKYAIDKNVNALRFVNEHTEELYKYAVKKDKYAVKYMDQKLLSDECVDALAAENSLCVPFLKNRINPEKYHELLLGSIEKSAKILLFVDELTPEIFNYSLIFHRDALKYVHYTNKTQEICKMAIEHDLINLKYCDQPIDLYVKIYNDDKRNIRYIMKTKTRALLTGTKCVFPEEIRDNDLCIICLDAMDNGDYVCKTACKHYFHTVCLITTVKKINEKYECALCKRNVIKTNRKTNRKTNIETKKNEK